MFLVFLGVIVIVGWTGIFVLIGWLITHAFTILNIVIWIGIGIISLPILTAMITISWFLLSTFISLIWQKIQDKTEVNKRYEKNNTNITSDTNYTKSVKSFWEDV